MSTAWLLSDISEAKGKQEMFTRQSRQKLKVLLEAALIQSAESSNRIEGVTVAPERLRPLVLGNAGPKDRSEQEVQCYLRALNEIHSRSGSMAISAATMKDLHKLCQPASGDAGEFKRVDNDIIQLRAGAAPVIRFKCVPAKATGAAVKNLCLSYSHVMDQALAHPLLATAALILDFLCIHPFRDGNGRAGRLLTLLTLYHHGYEVGRYISLERVIEQSKDEYYDALHRSSQGWHDSKHDLTPWVNFFLGVIRRAYVEFESRAGNVRDERGAKTSLILTAIKNFEETFRVADLQRECPGVSLDMIRKVLKELRGEKVECLGRGASAKWKKIGIG